MKTNRKIIIVAALAAAVVAVLALKNRLPPPVEGAPVRASATPSAAPGDSPAPAKLPKLVDLGAGKCLSCKLMTPVLEELKAEYAGRLEVVYIDVSKDPAAAAQYSFEIIPTQIFLDAGGRELFRHEGFFSKADILAKWKSLGVSLPPPPSADGGRNK